MRSSSANQPLENFYGNSNRRKTWATRTNLVSSEGKVVKERNGDLSLSLAFVRVSNHLRRISIVNFYIAAKLRLNAWPSRDKKSRLANPTIKYPMDVPDFELYIYIFANHFPRIAKCLSESESKISSWNLVKKETILPAEQPRLESENDACKMGVSLLAGERKKTKLSSSCVSTLLVSLGTCRNDT